MPGVAPVPVSCSITGAWLRTRPRQPCKASVRDTDSALSVAADRLGPLCWVAVRIVTILAILPLSYRCQGGRGLPSIKASWQHALTVGPSLSRVCLDGNVEGVRTWPQLLRGRIFLFSSLECCAFASGSCQLLPRCLNLPCSLSPPQVRHHHLVF